MATKPAGPAVVARKTARERMAAVTKANRDREHADAADLAQVLKASSTVARAATRRDTAIADAHQTYLSAASAVEAEQAAALARIKGRGTDESTLAELTGLDVGEVRRLLRLASPAPVPKPPVAPNARASAASSAPSAESSAAAP
ncbi:hypothetical protein [Nocardia sp. NBC_00511]|uniref:hypothetical protein n=1 Tax=Nocardia sp. NBC_00511 TaxID=2903591 RepID=UPI002F90DC46